MDPLRFFNIHSVAKHEKIEENKNFQFREKISQCRKKLKGGTLWDFSTSILSQNIKKNAGGPFGEKFFFEKKSVAVPKKNERGESLVSPGMVCYAEKQEKPFWFSSLDEIVHFDAITFCRTFVELFWSVRVDRKKRVTIIVAFHFMKRRLKKVLYSCVHGILATLICTVWYCKMKDRSNMSPLQFCSLNLNYFRPILWYCI